MSNVQDTYNLTAPRRIVTGHDKEGKAIVLKDSPVELQRMPRGVHLGVLWATENAPASNDSDFDPISVSAKDLTNENGSILRFVDFQPNNVTVSTTFREEVMLIKF